MFTSVRLVTNESIEYCSAVNHEAGEYTMEEVVGIRATDCKGRAAAFMTWGRLFDVTDDAELLRVVKHASTSCEGRPFRNFRLCYALKDIAQFTYFYESLLDFAWKPIPFGSHYKAWQRKMRSVLRQGREIYFLGPLKQSFATDRKKRGKPAKKKTT
jgi:hypothetical protein